MSDLTSNDRATKAVTCESIKRGSGLRCHRPAKWLTPLHRFACFQFKVCGQHKARYETAIHRCKPL